MADVARGKSDALEALIERHAGPLLTFIQRMTGDYHQGEELFQDVFLAVWCKRHLYQFPRPFKTWLYAIAVNRCRDRFRRAPPRAAPLADREIQEPLSARSSPLTTAMATETAALVAGAVALMPEPQREVVVLRVWQQMSYAEIGQVLDQPEATVRSHMHRGLSTLREMLEGRLGEDC